MPTGNGNVFEGRNVFGNDTTVGSDNTFEDCTVGSLVLIADGNALHLTDIADGLNDLACRQSRGMNTDLGVACMCMHVLVSVLRGRVETEARMGDTNSAYDGTTVGTGANVNASNFLESAVVGDGAAVGAQWGE